MSRKFSFVFGVLCVFGVVLCLGMPGMWGCAKKEAEPECTSNLDCEKNHSCVTQGGVKKCLKRGDVGDACEEGAGAGCVDGLICDKSTCKTKCETNFDCDKGEECDPGTGACKTQSTDGGVPEESGPRQKVGENCNPQKCEDGLDCIKLNDNASKCWKACTEDKDCSDSRVCAGGHCVPHGEACQYDKPGGRLIQTCWAGLECVLEGMVEGKCLRPCTGTDCPNGLSCVEKNNKKHCQQAGDKAGEGQPCGSIGGKQVDCVSGFKCIEKSLGSTDKVCTKECQDSAVCKWPAFCSAGVCSPGTVGDVQLGGDCSVESTATAAQRCAGGLFCLSAAQTDKMGKCYRDCTDSRADPCPSGTTCKVVSTSSKLCLKECTKPEDCPTEAPNCAQLQSGATACIHKSP